MAYLDKAYSGDKHFKIPATFESVRSFLTVYALLQEDRNKTVSSTIRLLLEEAFENPVNEEWLVLSVKRDIDDTVEIVRLREADENIRRRQVESQAAMH